MSQKSSKGAAAAQYAAIAVLALLAARTMMIWCPRIEDCKINDYSPVLETAEYVSRGQPLYRDFRQMPLTAPSQYGPIVPITVARLSHAFGGDSLAVLAAGRSLTIASTLLVCGLIFSLARRAGATLSSSAIAALAFMVSPLVQKWGFEYRVDMPALAFNLAGLLAFQGGFGPGAILLFAAAFFTKQNALTGIGMVLLWLVLKGDFRRAATFLMGYAFVVGACLATLTVGFPFYWLNTFTALGLYYDLTAPAAFLGHNVLYNVGLFTLAAYSLYQFGLTFCGCFFLIAMAGDSLSSLHWGGAIYYFLPTLAAAAILSGSAVDSLCDHAPAAPSLAAVLGIGGAVALSAAGILAQLSGDIALISKHLLRSKAPVSIAIAPDRCLGGWDTHSLSVLRATPGVIVTDSEQLALVDPQPNLEFIEPMTMSALVARGAFDDHELLRLIRQHRIAAFALTSAGLEGKYRGIFGFWPAFRYAVADNYEVVPSSCEEVLMVPKGSLRRSASDPK